MILRAELEFVWAWSVGLPWIYLHLLIVLIALLLCSCSNKELALFQVVLSRVYQEAQKRWSLPYSALDSSGFWSPSGILLAPAAVSVMLWVERWCSAPIFFFQGVGMLSNCVLPKIVIVAKMIYHEKFYIQVCFPYLMNFKCRIWLEKEVRPHNHGHSCLLRAQVWTGGIL